MSCDDCKDCKCNNKDKENEYEICPKCSQKTVIAKLAGGIECTNPNCDYWFCY